MILASLMVVIFGPLSVLGHGNMIWPPTWLGPNETIQPGNDYNKSIIMWFSNWTFIPGVATLDPSLYTLPDFHGDDYQPVEYIYPTTPDRNPWMAPGTARVFSPCGVAGGNPFGMSSTSFETSRGLGFSYGPDARDIDWKDAIFTKWHRGGKAEVGWGIYANHGGGYSYRLCKVGEDGPGGVTEDCFQKTPLKFSSENSWVQYGTDKSTRIEFKANRTTEGTYPMGSQWTMNPIPVCKNPIDDLNCPEGPLEFPARVKGLQGLFPFLSFPNSTLRDEVEVPEDLNPGKYVLSFRWDCEGTPQIWNACSNILII